MQFICSRPESAGPTGTNFSGNMIVDKIKFNSQSGEPDEFVSSRAITWAPCGMDQAIRVMRPFGLIHVMSMPRYTLKYSTSGSLRLNGFSTGSTWAPQVLLEAVSEVSIPLHPLYPSSSSIWVGIRPTMAIRACTGGGTHGGADFATPIGA